MFSLDTMTVTEIGLQTVKPSASNTTSGAGMSALAGLGGYMTLGFGAKAKPLLAKTEDDEVLIPQDSTWVAYVV